MTDYGVKRIPDNTELAYKEAVSKLRYFLSGNSAPSIRSYGGSSVKNLEDPDGHLDKKYTSPYISFSATTTRPRLTAKYTTLYADSLGNYAQPKASNVPSQPTAVWSAADLSGGTNPDVINFIQKQEQYIEQLEHESQYCRDELNNLLGKVKEVISENENLHEAQKNKIISRMFSYGAGSETDDLEDVGDSTGLDSDNKATPSSNHRPKTRTTKLEGPNIVFESRIAELEAQLTQAKIDLKKIQDENNENKRKLASGLVDSTCLDGFKRQIDNLQRDKSSLETQISKLKLNLEQKDGDLDSRYKRGSDVVEQQLREERNNLESEVRRLKEDLAKERSKIHELAGEGARRAMQERTSAEQRYNAHFDELQHDLSAQYDNVAKLQLDLDRQRREESDLKRELSMKNANIEELKMELKNKSAFLQADLAQAYAEKASLEEELASARLAIERQQRQAKHDTNRLNSEIQSLRQRLDRADADLVHSRRENLRLSEQIASLEKELNMKTLTPISPEKEKELSTMLESMENKHAKTVAELESMIQSQNSLMEKLTGECRLLTDKLDDANRRHKGERTQLLCRNAELMRKLCNLWSSHKKYCTALSPIRSYTPLSGYPNSRSSYDLDRTYLTSTPYTYRSRYRRSENSIESSSARDDIGILARNLSDLSIDKIGDSDDDPSKPCVVTYVPVCYREELATLQRQVELLGRSLKSNATPAPSQYQESHSAPAAHTTTAHGVLPNPASSATPVDTGDVTTRNPTPKQPGKQPDQLLGGDNQTERINEQHYENPTEDDAPNTTQPDTIEHSEMYETIDQSQVETTEENSEYQTEMETEQPIDMAEPVDNQQYEDNYEQYEQNYEQNPETNTEYHEEYDKSQIQQEGNEQVGFEEIRHEGNEQTGYEQQQYENYEQYPQQYADPNAQFEGQFENYEADGNYQGDYTDPSYNQYQSENQEQSEVHQETDKTSNLETTAENIQETTELSTEEPLPTKAEIKPNQTEPNVS